MVGATSLHRPAWPEGTGTAITRVSGGYIMITDADLDAIRNADSDFATQIEAGAKALGFRALTDLGRQTCDWIHDFSEVERAELRATTLIVLQATTLPDPVTQSTTQSTDFVLGSEVALHHPFCNFFVRPREGCRQCERLFQTCPIKPGQSPAELIAERWPDAKII
jgi:hypothetical protein